MKHSPVSKQIPAWQIERAAKLHRACQRIQAAIARGEKVTRVIRRVAARANGKRYRSAPGRQLALSFVTLRRAWDVWRRNGQLPASLRVHYRSEPSITAPVLVRFSSFCANQQFPSLQQAWHVFIAQPGSFGKGRRFRPLVISYSQLCRYFPAATFYSMQSHLKAIHREQAALNDLRLRTIAELNQRLPTHLPRRRASGAISFEI